MFTLKKEFCHQSSGPVCTSAQTKGQCNTVVRSIDQSQTTCWVQILVLQLTRYMASGKFFVPEFLHLQNGHLVQWEAGG